MLVCMQATVGAGLPVIATLKHLVDTGDRILKVEGIFSGTLSYIFNMFSQDKPFSEIVTEAKALGYTEPDPRDDLAGMDVARKVTILARYSFVRARSEENFVASLCSHGCAGLWLVLHIPQLRCWCGNQYSMLFWRAASQVFVDSNR